MNGSYQLQNFTKNRDTEVTRLKAQVELFFEKEFEIYRKIGLKDGMDIIECGSGPGFLIKSIVEKLPGCNATGLEIDPFLFSVLTENSQSNGRQIFKAVNGSIYDTRLPDNSFDFVVTRLVVEHLEEPLKAIYELNRILRPGGKLVIVSNDFAYHLITYPVITELDEMYDAYCKSRLSEGGNPYIARQLPVYLSSAGFENVNFEIVTSHSRISGDEPFLKAENVNISKSLVESGFLNRNTLATLVEKWFEMLKDPNHVFYRQLFVVSGGKSTNKVPGSYTESIERALKGKKPLENRDGQGQASNLDQQREKFRSLISKSKQFTPGPGSDLNAPDPLNNSFPQNSQTSVNGNKFRDITSLETALLSIWKDLLKQNSISKDDNYFDIGGDSVLIPEIVVRLENDHGIKIRILDLFDNPSIRTLADYIRKKNL
jgi:ubiquinone/menaquinone biosynthesis C-methylase UbiE/acyl carrier protein